MFRKDKIFMKVNQTASHSTIKSGKIYMRTFKISIKM